MNLPSGEASYVGLGWVSISISGKDITPFVSEAPRSCQKTNLSKSESALLLIFVIYI